MGESEGGETLKTRVLKEARELLSERGADDFSMREVARRAGVSIGTLQYHYRTRDELVEACVDDLWQWIRRVQEQLSSDALASLSRPDAVAWAVREGFRYARNNRSFVRLLEKTITDAGGLASRRFDMHTEVLTGLARWLAGDSLHAERELMLRVQSVIMLIARYAILDEPNLTKLTGESDPAQAEARASEHLISAAKDLVLRRGGV